MSEPYEVQPLAVDPSAIVNWFRSFLANVRSNAWLARVRIAVGSATEVLQATRAWFDEAWSAADAYGRRSLAPIDRQLEVISAELDKATNTLAATGDTSAVWAAVALPLAFGPFSIWQRLVSSRNQLLWHSAPPVLEYTSSSGFKIRLQSLGTPAGYASDALDRSVTFWIAQAEKSAPGEAKTARDYAEAAAATVAGAVQAVAKKTTDWFWIAAGVGAVVLARR